jgi:hypothetical protein
MKVVKYIEVILVLLSAQLGGILKHDSNVWETTYQKIIFSLFLILFVLLTSLELKWFLNNNLQFKARLNNWLHITAFMVSHFFILFFLAFSEVRTTMPIWLLSISLIIGFRIIIWLLAIKK